MTQEQIVRSLRICGSLGADCRILGCDYTAYQYTNYVCPGVGKIMLDAADEIEKLKRELVNEKQKSEEMVKRIVERLEDKKKEQEDILHYGNPMSMFAREELFRKIGLIKRCIDIVKEEGGLNET